MFYQNASDLKGLTKQEKMAKSEDVRDKYRKQKQENIVKSKLDEETQRRENIKKGEEAERKRKEYEMRMIASKKKREKNEAERRKKAIKEKIAADNKRRLELKAKEKRNMDMDNMLKLKDLNVDQMIYLIKNEVIKDESHSLYGYRDFIEKYFMENKINGDKFKLLMEKNKDEFIGKLKNFINANDNKLNNLLRVFLSDVVKLKIENVKFV